MAKNSVNAIRVFDCFLKWHDKNENLLVPSVKKALSCAIINLRFVLSTRNRVRSSYKQIVRVEQDQHIILFSNHANIYMHARFNSTE